MSAAKLPSFKNPPVVETVLGVQFQDIEGWGVPHIGLFWETIRSDFPVFSVHPEITSHIENDSPLVQQVEAQIELINQPEIRCWFVSSDGRLLIQLQHDRFLVNWRKQKAADQYPRFDSTVALFRDLWSKFTEFLTSSGLKAPSAIQCEVTYVNHIPRGKGWKNGDDWSQVFTCVKSQAIDSSVPVESCAFQLTYAIPGKRGRLRINASQAMTAQSAQEIILLNLTSRGRPATSDSSDITAWLATGWEWIVRGFSAITTPEMHALWGREDV